MIYLSARTVYEGTRLHGIAIAHPVSRAYIDFSALRYAPTTWDLNPEGKMWSNNKQSDYPGATPAQPATHPASPSTSSFNPNAAPASSAPVRSSVPSARNLATLGPGLTVKGQISGEEDLQIDGKVEGPISLKGQRLTIGQNGEIVSDVHAREVIVYGKVRGNLHAEDRVEVKKDGSVVGNITGGRVLIEDGAYLKGQIEIERGKSKQHAAEELEAVGVGSGKASN
jgi:cytoskeletal protein CcmA (bactofilin family)